VRIHADGRCLDILEQCAQERCWVSRACPKEDPSRVLVLQDVLQHNPGCRSMQARLGALMRHDPGARGGTADAALGQVCDRLAELLRRRLIAPLSFLIDAVGGGRACMLNPALLPPNSWSRAHLLCSA